MMTYGNKRDESIDLARCISCIGVVIIHAIAVYWYGTPVVLKGVEQYFENESLKLLEWETLSWSLCSVIDAGARFSVPVFVMISGALLLNRKNGLDTAYIIKKCIHLVELILAWGGVYALYDLIQQLLSQEEIIVKQFIQDWLFGPSNFWFIFMLIPLYLSVPILAYILKEKRLTEWMLLLWFVGTIVLVSLKSWSPLLNGRVELAYMSIIPEYTGMFMLGAYYKRYGVGRKVENIVLILGLLCFIAMSFGTPAGYFHNFTTPFCCIYAFAIFILCSRYADRQPKTLRRIVRCIAGHSLGIYALHGLMLTILRSLWIPQSKHWFLQFVLAFTIVFSVSLATSAVLNRIPGLKKLV